MKAKTKKIQFCLVIIIGKKLSLPTTYGINS